MDAAEHRYSTGFANMNTNKKAFINQCTVSINGVTITDNGDGSYAYSLPTATGGIQTVSDGGNGSAVVNNYTSAGTLTSSETTGFDANACSRYKFRSCLRTNLLGYRPKTYLKTTEKCQKISTRLQIRNTVGISPTLT